MVRFSDMLGGNSEPDATPATTVAPLASEAEPAPANESEPEPDGAPEPEPVAATDHPAPETSPEDVLDRLTQYASSARPAAAPVPEPPVVAPATAPVDDADENLTPVGDDLLPHPKAETRKRRRK